MKKPIYLLTAGMLLGASALSLLSVQSPITAEAHAQTATHSYLDPPAKADFAGEAVPMSDIDVLERFDREMIVTLHYHSNTFLTLKRASRYLPTIERVLKEEGIPDDFKYLAMIESSLVPNVQSPAGARGMWQLLPETGKQFGLTVNEEVDERADVEKSTRAAARYLRKAYEKFGNWTLAAASYNRGMAGISRAADDQLVSDYYDLWLNEETSRYLFRILSMKEIYEHPERYPFQLEPQQRYQPEAVRYLTLDQSVRWADFAKQQGTTVKMLRRYNPWINSGQITLKAGESIQVALPAAK